MGAFLNVLVNKVGSSPVSCEGVSVLFACPFLEQRAVIRREQIRRRQDPRARCLVEQIQRHPSGKPDYQWAAATGETGPRITA